MFCRSAGLLKLFTLLGVYPMARGLLLAGKRIRVKIDRSSRIPPDILSRGIACARSRSDVGEDKRCSIHRDDDQAVSSTVNVLDWEGGRGKPGRCCLTIALVLHRLA